MLTLCILSLMYTYILSELWCTESITHFTPELQVLFLLPELQTKESNNNAICLL
jgi:hypothetical protein